jgi:Ca2+-transporting ATPase
MKEEKGLTTKQIEKLQKKYGKNELLQDKKQPFIIKIFHVLCEPMFLLLIIASTIYFLLGEPKDGFIMLIFIVAIISIDIIQEWKTDKTLNALKDLSEPKIEVLRNGQKELIASSNLVPGDIMYIYEGIKIPADGQVIECSGLRVDESSLTGEAEGVWKSSEKDTGKDYWKTDTCYQGTLVIQGTGIIKVTSIGAKTEYGKIGLNLTSTEKNISPLEKQTNELVKICAIIAIILFILVSVLTFINLKNLTLSTRFTSSILSGVTLAMSMIPEEYPVVLTVFLSMGAWRLARKNSLVKKLPSIETLGAVTTLCVDKTGTITQNKMSVEDSKPYKRKNQELAYIMGLCCEKNTYDPMEKAMLKFCEENEYSKKELFSYPILKEYPFDNNTKIMGKVIKTNEGIVLAAKGSPENILKICPLKKTEINKLNHEILSMQERGLRVIGIASKTYQHQRKIPQQLSESTLDFIGLVGLIDPPRENIAKEISACKKAGIKVVMITGDNGITASSIASMIGMDNKTIITGDDLNQMSDKELQEKVKTVNIFSRVIPEHKMRIVQAFQNNGEVVAMTGDGVNDAPALKKADIGIAMGKRGSEVSREAADLILMDDNFATIVDTIKDGRRIYDNIVSSMEYILVIHLPIALICLFAPLLHINPQNLMLLPVHIVLLELVIDPTCSVVFERQPGSPNLMKRKPRNKDSKLINSNLLLKSISQGLTIFIISFTTYYIILTKLNNPPLARTFGLLIILFANIFLVQENSSNEEIWLKSVYNLAKDKTLLLINLFMLIVIFLIVYSPLNTIFKLQTLKVSELLITILLAFISVIWYEIVKINTK